MTAQASRDSMTAGQALADIQGRAAWAVVRLGNSDSVVLLGGDLTSPERIVDIDLPEGLPEAGRRYDRLVAVPYRQVAERGFVAQDDGTPLAVVAIDVEHEVARA
ncbi:MAG: hypothetical protein ACTHOG_03620, partial [Marmoricola sp.]